MWRYNGKQAATVDALRLAEGMALKNALAELPFGGGKAVICLPDGPFDREALFRTFGREVAALKGRYVTAEDVGTSVADMESVARETRHVAGLPARRGQPGGDPSPWTALGVLQAMRVAVRHRLGAELSDVTVAVQGLGHVGFALCELLHQEGAKLVLAEPRSEVAARAADRFGAMVMSSRALLSAKVDVLAPCALGAVLDAPTVAGLRASVVCGAANNQLADEEVARTLAAQGVLYAPDFLVNAGGIVNVAGEYLDGAQRGASPRPGHRPAHGGRPRPRRTRWRHPASGGTSSGARPDRQCPAHPGGGVKLFFCCEVKWQDPSRRQWFPPRLIDSQICPFPRPSLRGEGSNGAALECRLAISEHLWQESAIRGITDYRGVSSRWRWALAARFSRTRWAKQPVAPPAPTAEQLPMLLTPVPSFSVPVARAAQLSFSGVT